MRGLIALLNKLFRHIQQLTHIRRTRIPARLINNRAIDMGDNFANSSIQRNFQDFAVVVEVNTAGWLQPEIMTCAGFSYCNKLIAMLQTAHREVFNRAAAHIFQQSNRRFQRHNAVWRVAGERTGEILTMPTVPVGDTRPLTTVSF